MAYSLWTSHCSVLLFHISAHTWRLTFCLHASSYRLRYPVMSTDSHNRSVPVVIPCEFIRLIPFPRLKSMDEDIPTFYVKTLPGTEHFRNGGSGILYTYPGCTTEVIKLPFSSEASTANLEIEKRVYQRLGYHPNIIRCLRIEDYGIHLERAKHSSVREYYAEGGSATLEERMKWSRDVANALQYIHEHNVRHADLSGKNVLLDSSRTVRLCDFAGSAIDDNPSTVWAQSGFRHPDDDEVELSTTRAELHALGSTIFEIITFSQPHG
jgi:serine/threonine protein kinase